MGPTSLPEQSGAGPGAIGIAEAFRMPSSTPAQYRDILTDNGCSMTDMQLYDAGDGPANSRAAGARLAAGEQRALCQPGHAGARHLYLCHERKPQGTRPCSGGLSTWQTRAAKEMISAHLDGNLPLQRVAEVCGLSTSHFAHAFRRTVGVAPHRWLLRRRVERAIDMLGGGRDSLSDIALACGFSDQSHFTRVFRRATGHSPGGWKRQLH
jgi:AraC-like DNA-binding protein